MFAAEWPDLAAGVQVIPEVRGGRVRRDCAVLAWSGTRPCFAPKPQEGRSSSEHPMEEPHRVDH
jgi:hypothetical protein